MQAELEAK
jgi:dynein heavy chain